MLCLCMQDPLTYIGMIQDLHYSNFSEELKRKKNFIVHSTGTKIQNFSTVKNNLGELIQKQGTAHTVTGTKRHLQ